MSEMDDVTRGGFTYSLSSVCFVFVDVCSCVQPHAAIMLQFLYSSTQR